ncbi:BTB/POZ domain-containing protein 7 [Phthorimaea operculella]|nr:BTB/POZ domain-containing protein 7 [Phthorimaea operculella]
MGAALSLQEGEACEGGLAVAPPTMADVIRERKKKAGGAGLGTLRRRLAAAARRPKDSRPDRGCEHARFIRSVVSSWRVAEVFVLCEQLEAGAALRDLCTQAELAREPAQALHIDLAAALHTRWWCDVELVGAGWSIPAHRAILAARSSYFRNLMLRYPTSQWRVPLEGPGARLSREEMEACLVALYSGTMPSLCTHSCSKWERGSQDQLDIINVDNTGTLRSLHGCSCYEGSARRRTHSEGGVRRAATALGFSPDSLHRDMRYLLDSGEYADSRLVFRLEGGCGVQYGFRTALELPVHRVILAARSRFFRSVMTRRTSNPSSSTANSNAHSGCVCVDEKVLPRRFARALLHAAYTDQVDLSLIGRASTPPSTNNNAPTNASSSPWPGVARSAGGNTTNSGSSALDDAFQLYEIARFLEMPIVVQGCEDCIVEALSPETLPGVLRWACAPHASQWVHRQAMRYLRDEFPTIMSHAAAVRLPRTALAEALSSPFLQASEAQALRALMRWGVHHQPQPQQREPNVVWHTAHSVSRRVGGGGRRRDVSDAAVREALADLITLVRVEHLPPDNELLQQAIRRGLIDPPAVPEETGSADAWLGRGSYRPARCFLPYLDELKALLEEQAAPEAEVARVRRARLTHRIPDTLYMVAAARNTTDSPAPAESSGAESAWCVSPRALGALRTRLRELSAAPPAATALKLHSGNPPPVYRQTNDSRVSHGNTGDSPMPAESTGAESAWCVSPRALGALRTRLRELSAAPPAATALKLHSGNPPPVYRQIALRAVREILEEPWTGERQECSRTLSGSGSLRCASAGSLRSAPSLHIPIDTTTRAGTCRRELPSRPDSSHRSSMAECSTLAARLSAAVPDVAMAPNANTHLLTNRDYCRHPPPAEYGPVLQLDLGDGATHTPRPGSRAFRAAHSAERARREQQGHSSHTHSTHSSHSVAAAIVPALAARTRQDEDERRAALQLSVIRAYSGFVPVAGGSPLLHTRRSPAPHPHYRELPPYATVRNRTTPSPSLSGGSRVELPALTHRRDDGRLSVGASVGASVTPQLVVGGVGGVAAGEASSRSPSASPRRTRRDTLYRDYRLEATYGPSTGPGSASGGSRGPSPNNYA